MGGRGSGGPSFGFSFGTPIEGGSNNNLFPAYANVRIKTKTLEGAMDEFRGRYKNADHEWAYVVDQQGYVHEYVEGGRSSVSVSKNEKGLTLLHNHPSGSAFSGQDLISVSEGKYKGVVASGKNYDYVFQKNSRFKATEFSNAVRNAKMTGNDYSEGVHRWLTKNQRKYGYKYHRSKND